MIPRAAAKSPRARHSAFPTITPIPGVRVCAKVKASSAGVEGPDGAERFRDWLASVLERHLSRSENAI